MNNVPRSWQFSLGIFGSLLWLASFKLMEFTRDIGWTKTSLGLSGYIMGVVTAFSGWVLWQLLKGNSHKFIDRHPFFRWFSIISLFFIFLFGAFGFVVEIWGDTPWFYNLSFVAGSIVVAEGLVPLIEVFESESE